MAEETNEISEESQEPTLEDLMGMTEEEASKHHPDNKVEKTEETKEKTSEESEDKDKEKEESTKKTYSRDCKAS